MPVTDIHGHVPPATARVQLPHSRSVVERPGQETVAYRALCLAALTQRGELEQVVRNLGRRRAVGDPADEAATLVEWLYRVGVAPRLSNRERELFSQDVGYWDMQDVINVSWRVESLGVMLWALRIVPTIPPYDEKVNPKVVIDRVPVQDDLAVFFEAAQLRSVPELVRAREVAEVWHWRSRAFRLQRQGTRPAHGSWAEILEQAIRRMNEAIGADVLRGDFPLFGKLYSHLNDEEYDLAASVARERHYALNWLCGFADDWDHVPTET